MVNLLIEPHNSNKNKGINKEIWLPMLLALATYYLILLY